MNVANISTTNNQYAATRVRPDKALGASPPPCGVKDVKANQKLSFRVNSLKINKKIPCQLFWRIALNMSRRFCCQKKFYLILYLILSRTKSFYCLSNSTSTTNKTYDVGFRIVGGENCAVNYPFFVSQFEWK